MSAHLIAACYTRGATRTRTPYVLVAGWFPENMCMSISRYACATLLASFAANLHAARPFRYYCVHCGMKHPMFREVIDYADPSHEETTTGKRICHECEADRVKGKDKRKCGGSLGGGNADTTKTSRKKDRSALPTPAPIPQAARWTPAGTLMSCCVLVVGGCPTCGVVERLICMRCHAY